MNTQTYRLVFNPARACLVAVAETARGCGKSSTTGGTRATRRKRVSPGSCKQNSPLALVDIAHTAINSIVKLQSSGGSLSNTGTLSSNGNLTIGMTGSVANNKRGFILGGSTITVAAGSVTNDGIVYGLGGAPSTITINASGGFSNGSTGVLIAGSQLNITASSFSNAGDNVSAGVGSLGDASLSTTGVWDAGSNPLRVNGLLTAATNGITVDVGKTWEQSNVTWSGVLLNYGSTNLGIGNGAVVNQSSGVTTFTTAPDPIALADTYAYNTSAPSGYTGATLVGYTDVTNRAQFTAGAFTGSFVNVAGDISGNITAVGGGANIAQNVIWSGVPVATPAAPAEEVSVASASLPRAFLTANSVVTLVSPGTIEGGAVTVNAGDLTVDHSNTGAAQGGISSAQNISVGNISASPAVLALLQNPALLTAAALQATAPHPSAQTNAIASGTVTSTVGASAPTGTAGSFTTNPNAGGGASSGEGGPTLALPAPDFSTVQGAWAALVANQLKPIATDWAALSAPASNLAPISQVPASTASTTPGTSTSAQDIAQWLQYDSQGLARINSAAVLLAQQKAQAKREADAALRDPTLITTTGGTLAAVHGDLAIDATGQLTLTNTQVRAQEGVAHIYGSQGVTIAATQQDVTTTTTTGQFQTQEIPAVAGGVDSEAQAATTVVVGGSVTTTTRTTSEWGTSSVDAKQIDIQSGQGSVTIDSSDLTATNGIRISAAQDVKILAQRGVDNTSSSTNAVVQSLVGAGDNMELRNVITTTQGDTSNQETLRTSSLHAGAGTLSITASSGNISGQSAQLSGDKVVLVTGTLDKNGNLQGGGSIDLQSLQTQGSAVSGDQSRITQTLTTTQGSITANNGVTILAGQDVILNAQDITAGQGAVAVGASGNILLGANADTTQTDQTTHSSSSSWLGLVSSSTNTHSQTVNTTPTTTTLKGQSVTVVAGDTLTSLGATLDGTDSVYAEGQKDQKFYAVQSENKTTVDSKTIDSFLGFGYQDKTSTDSNLTRRALSTTLISDQKVTIGLGQKADLQGTTITAPKIAFTRTDPNAAEPELILGAATNTTQTSHTEKTTTLGVWQAQSGQGATDQTLTQTTLNGQVSFDNAIKITAQLPQGDLKTQISTLGAQGGLSYLTELANKPDVKWDQVATVHDQWSYSQQGLTPAGAALLAIVVAVLTNGMGSELLGTATTTAGATTTTLGGVTLSTTTAATATAAATTTTFAAGAMVNAGFTTLVTTASTSFINNGGDIGKTLNDLGSNASVRTLVTSMLGAGAVNVVGTNLTIDGMPMNQVTVANSSFTANLTKNVTTGAVTAVVDSAVNNKPINVGNIVGSALVTTTAATGANLIGDLATPQNGQPATIDAGTQLVSHAVLGCVVGAATAGNTSGCAPGAAGAVVGEVAANIATNNGANKADALGIATVTAAATGVLVGGGGDNVAANNFLKHTRPSMLRLSEQEQYDAASASCAKGDQAACGTRNEFAALSKQRDADLQKACSGATPALCNQTAADAATMGNVVTTLPSGYTFANSPTPSPLNTATIGTPTRPDSFQDAASRSTSEALALEVGNQAVGALVGLGVKGFTATKSVVGDFFASQGIAAGDSTLTRIANNFGKDGDSFTTAAEQMVAAKNAGWTTPGGRIWWPPGSGEVPGTTFETTLSVGTKLDRYGGTTPNSTFLAPSGTSLEQRALSPTTNTAVHDEYVVLRPLPVEQSNTMPWFGQQGMGQQFNTVGKGGVILKDGRPATIQDLVDLGYLKKVSP